MPRFFQILSTLPLLLILSADASAAFLKGMDTRDISPACVLATVKDVVALRSRWWLRTDRGLVPILGVEMPDALSGRGKRLMRWLKARYRGEDVKICHPAWKPLGRDIYGFIYSEPWPNSLQDEIVGKGLADPRRR